MSSQQPTCTFDITVSICGKDEIRVVDNCKGGEVRQKVVSAVASPDQTATHWKYDELQDIACFLHDAPEFKTQQFQPYRHLILNLGYVLTHDHTRQSLADAMLVLMNAWFELCRNDRECIAPPSRATLGDKQQLKILAAISALETQLERERHNSTQKQQILLAGQQPLDAKQQELLDKFADEEAMRKS